MSFDLQSLPAWPQSQADVNQQIVELAAVANRLGLHDAANVLQMSKNLGSLQYGCHVDIHYDADYDAEPDGCVIDTSNPYDCIYAREGMRKEQCRYWRIFDTQSQEADR